MQISDLAGLSKPLTRLIEVISKGIGAVSRPYLLRRIADARAYEVRAVSAALNDVAEKHHLPVVYKDGSVELWQKPGDNTLQLGARTPEERTASRIDYQERKRQQNIEHITAAAAAELSNEEDVAEERPNDDWISRFFSSAQDVSSEQMQELWGRILAGEIKRPGSYSLKTLEFIKNVTQPDAALLERVGKLALRHANVTVIAIHDMPWLRDRRDIHPAHHFAISELGAMYPTDLQLTLFQHASMTEVHFASGALMLLVRRGDSTGAIDLPIWKFTTVGRELLELIPTDDPDEEYLESLGRFFLGRKATATLARFIERTSDGRIRYQPLRDIGPLPPKAPPPS